MEKTAKAFSPEESSAALIIALEQVVAVALAVATLHDVESKKAAVWPQEHFKRPKAV